MDTCRSLRSRQRIPAELEASERLLGFALSPTQASLKRRRLSGLQPSFFPGGRRQEELSDYPWSGGAESVTEAVSDRGSETLPPAIDREGAAVPRAPTGASLPRRPGPLHFFNAAQRLSLDRLSGAPGKGGANGSAPLSRT